MVTIFDLFSKEPIKFYSEIKSISKSSIKILLDDPINDEQFEKLLKRRDDLINSSEEQQKPPPQLSRNPSLYRLVSHLQLVL